MLLRRLRLQSLRRLSQEQSKFRCAAKASLISDINSQLQRGTVDVNSPDAQGRTAIIDSAWPRHHAIVERLIRSRADVNATDAIGTSPLHSQLLQAGGDSNLPNRIGRTPLHAAAGNGHMGCLELMLGEGADPNCKSRQFNQYGFIATSIACFFGFTYVLAHMGQAVDKPLFLCDPTEFLQAGLAAAEVNSLAPRAIGLTGSRWRKFLTSAAAEESKGNQVDKLKTDKLLQLAAVGNAAAVRRLLSECKDSRRLVNATDAQGRTALHLAAWRGHFLIVQLLIKHGANPNIQDSLGNTPAFRAAWHGQTESLRYLLDHGASPNLRNKIGRSPLHVAAENGHPEIVRLLVEAGANVDLPDKEGYSPVHSAAEKGLPEVLKILIQSGANLDLATPGPLLTPLHIAAGYGHFEAIRKLLEAKADVLALDKLGRSVLHYAALTGRRKLIIDLFLKAGCSPELRDSRGLTPADLACCFGNVTTVVQLLRDNRELPGATKDQAKLVEELHRLSTDSTPELRIESTDEALSMDLHEAMNKAGFSKHSAKAQIFLAKKLEKILQHRWNNKCLYGVGSFFEAWGNSLRSLNGVTDSDADIDVAEISPDRVLHLHGFCQCERREGASDIEYVDYRRGHVECPGVPSSPNQAWSGSASRPHIDSIPAIRLCCYPTLKLPELGKSHIRPEVIKDIMGDMNDTKRLPPHLVAASEPNCEGRQLRLSKSFLERRLIRSLTDEQGQVFVVLKHIIKQVLPKRSVKGLKTYHTKTLMFYLLDETPAEDWQAENLVNRVERGLSLLLENLNSNPQQDNSCMQHFFLPDAPLYLKKNHNSKSVIATAVKNVIKNKDLPDLIRSYMKKRLRNSQTNGGEFSFNPFLILPDPNPSSDGLSNSTGTIDSRNIYNAVQSIWVRLSHHKNESEYESLMRDISRLPDCASTVRCCLKALTSLKYGKEDEAKDILGRFQETSCGFIRHDDLENADNVDKFLQNKFDTCDWVKTFCFVFADPPERKFLPKSVRPHFPICILYVNMFLINFQALYRALCLQLGVANEIQQSAWFKEILEQDEAQLQEILVMLQFCKDRDMLVSLIHKHRKAIREQKDSSDMALQLMLADPQLKKLSITRSLEEALERLRPDSGT